MNWRKLKKNYSDDLNKLSELNKKSRQTYLEGLCSYIRQYLNKYNILLEIDKDLDFKTSRELILYFDKFQINIYRDLVEYKCHIQYKKENLVKVQMSLYHTDLDLVLEELHNFLIKNIKSINRKGK